MYKNIAGPLVLWSNMACEVWPITIYLELAHYQIRLGFEGINSPYPYDKNYHVTGFEEYLSRRGTFV